ncbi:MAG: ABC transporter permease [Chloroflexi bacterium]|nr:ABC transporter permease [Chloroflexota bacterium]MBU1747367.1 ABC transporter permease [Chloroflexota bacterium]
MAIPVLAVFTALVIGAILIWLSTGDPFKIVQAYWGLLVGSLGSTKAISETIVWATPYIFAGLAVALAFKCGLFNIGAEGQLLIGSLTSVWVAYALPHVVGLEIPAIIHIPLCLAAGVLGGLVWGAIPGILKAKTGGHEVINTIMMNYIALYLTNFLLAGPMMDPDPNNAVAQTEMIALTARMPRLIPWDPNLRVHWGSILAIAVAIGVWWFLYKTTWGFEIRTVGTNPDAAKYAGISVTRNIVLAMALSGALAGIAGAVEVIGLNYYHTPGFSAGYGFDSIAIALLGKTHPIGVIPAALLFGALRNGATEMQFLTQIPVDIISVIQSLILLFVAAPEIIRLIYRLRPSKEEEKLVLTRGWGG